MNYRMARKVIIIDGPGANGIIEVDGAKITDVLSYIVERRRGRCTLTMEVEVMEEIKTNLDRPI